MVACRKTHPGKLRSVRRRVFNRWFGIGLAFLVAPLITAAVAFNYLDARQRSGPYNAEAKDIRPARVVTSEYHHDTRAGSFCTVVLSSNVGPLTADVEDGNCAKYISAGDQVTFRYWRGDATNIWDGSNSLWTNHNPNYQVDTWFPLTMFFSAGTLALMVWAVWNFRRGRLSPGGQTR